MRDEQLARILEALVEQGQYLRTIVYSIGEMSNLSLKPLQKLIPNLRDLHLTKLTNSNTKHAINQIVESILNKGKRIERIKMSNVNLGGHSICQSICRLLEDSTSLIHLDLSWSKLLPRFLNQIARTLASLDY